MRRTPQTTIATLALAGTLVLGACAGETTDQNEGAGDGPASTAGPEPAEDTAPDDAAGTAAPDGAGTTAGDQAGATADDAGTTVDVDALPDPVAEVNGEEISQEDFRAELEPELEFAREQAEMTGGPVDEVAVRDAVLDNMVSKELVRQEGERLGIEAGEEEVDAELETLAEENGMEPEEFLTAVEEQQGMTEEDAREELAVLVLFDGILEDRGGVEPPSEDELKEYYEQLTGQPADDSAATEEEADGAAATEDAAQAAPPYEELRDQLEQQLTSQQEQEKLVEIMEELRQDADIELHV